MPSCAVNVGMCTKYFEKGKAVENGRRALTGHQVVRNDEGLLEIHYWAPDYRYNGNSGRSSKVKNDIIQQLYDFANEEQCKDPNFCFDLSQDDDDGLPVYVLEGWYLDSDTRFVFSNLSFDDEQHKQLHLSLIHI